MTSERDAHQKRADEAYCELFDEKQALFAAAEKNTSLSVRSDDQAIKISVLEAALESADFQHQKKLSEMEETHLAAIALLRAEKDSMTDGMPSGNNAALTEELRVLKAEND